MNFDANQIAGSNQLYQLSRLTEGHGLWHLGTVGEVTSSASFAIPVAAIPAGAAIVNGTVLGAVSGANVTLTAAHATLPRRDVIWVDSGGALGKTDGTAATNPAPPALTAARLALAEVYVAATATSIASGDITDKRQILSGSRFVMKTANETVGSSTVLQNDDHLFFSIGPGEKWEIDMVLATSLNTTEGVAMGFTIPASATLQGSWILMSATTVVLASVAASGASFDAGVLSAVVTSVRFHGVVINPTNAGTVQLQWAQSVSGAGTTRILGDAAAETFLIARRVF